MQKKKKMPYPMPKFYNHLYIQLPCLFVPHGSHRKAVERTVWTTPGLERGTKAPPRGSTTAPAGASASEWLRKHRLLLLRQPLLHYIIQLQQ